MAEQHDYNISKDIKFGFLNLIDIEKIGSEVKDDWFNQTLCQVNDCVVELAYSRRVSFTGISTRTKTNSFS